MGKFKVGDRVRDVSYNDLLATVTSTDGNRVCVLYDGDMPGSSIMWPETDFVPVAEVTGTAATGKPKFKIGDRVRVSKKPTNGGYGEIGDTGTVADVGAGDVYMAFDSGKCADESWWISNDEIELVAVAPSALTIREGAYYRTRDGRKVGPMNPDGEKFVWTEVDGVVRSFEREGGGHYIDELNLVAEWVDEPAVATTPTPTTGFTVPLWAEEDGSREVDEIVVRVTVDASELNDELDLIGRRLKKLKKRARKLGLKLDYAEAA